METYQMKKEGLLVHFAQRLLAGCIVTTGCRPSRHDGHSLFRWQSLVGHHRPCRIELCLDGQGNVGFRATIFRPVFLAIIGMINRFSFYWELIAAFKLFGISDFAARFFPASASPASS